MNTCNCLIATASVALAASTLALPAAQAEGIGFVPVKVGSGQSLRIGLSNLVDVPDPRFPPEPCRGTVAFYDGAGSLSSKSVPFTLAAGHTFYVSMPTPTSSVTRQATVHFISPDTASPSEGPCRAVYAGEEIFNVSTGQTQFMNPGVIRGFNPQPDPPIFKSAE